MIIKQHFIRSGYPIGDGKESFTLKSSQFILSHEVIPRQLRGYRGNWWMIKCPLTKRTVYRTLTMNPTLHMDDKHTCHKIVIDWDAWLYLKADFHDLETLDLEVQPLRWRSLYLWPFFTFASPDPLIRMNGVIVLLGIVSSILGIIDFFKD